VFTPQGGGQVYRVPYAGFKGNYQSIVGMPAIFGGLIPNIGRQVAPGTFDLADPGETFTLASPNEIPFFLVHLDHQVRSLKIEVIDAVTAKNWQRAFFQEYLSRNSTATGFFALPFDGNTVNGNILKPVPNGTYYFRVTLVKALGDAANPADLETFTSANFVIARP
jgi:minor extracellular serine protease Vpr